MASINSELFSGRVVVPRRSSISEAEQQQQGAVGGGAAELVSLGAAESAVLEAGLESRDVAIFSFFKY